MEAAHALDLERSALAQARIARQLPLREAARRAGLTEDEVTWLEQGRVYRFRSPDDAMLALLLYSTALGVQHREARELAGLPVPPKPLATNPLGRLLVLGGVAAALVALVAALVLPGRDADRARRCARLPGDARDAREPIRLSADRRLLPARRRRDRVAARPPARRRLEAAARRCRQAATRRHRRPAQGPGRLAARTTVSGEPQASA